MFQGPRQASDHEISAGMTPGARFFHVEHDSAVPYNERMSIEERFITLNNRPNQSTS
ncbi:MAG: hypothetical protein Q3M24_20535 [Candidatus Electrothrix aestuarii]|uniref:Uncharacterized protein n=1 Tax=Candidatus Electrothrix aestuarii TaxID=3062594 RepID=A0AAU8LTM5_9BACT|nr:hypothetical protein [Candidatus Electrothrix aestuarii]